MIRRIENRIVRVFIDICIYLFILILAHLFLGRPAIKKLNKEKEELGKLQKELEQMESLVKEVPNPKKKIEELHKKMKDFKSKSASDRELPKIIRELTKKSSELNIEIISIKPVSEVPFEEKELPQGVSKFYIEVVLKAPYKVLGEYLKALEELPILLTIETLSIEKPEVEEFSTGERKTKRSKSKQTPENKIIATLLISSYKVWKI